MPDKNDFSVEKFVFSGFPVVLADKDERSRKRQNTDLSTQREQHCSAATATSIVEQLPQSQSSSISRPPHSRHNCGAAESGGDPLKAAVKKSGTAAASFSAAHKNPIAKKKFLQ